MTKKALKIALLLGVLALIVLSAGVVMAEGATKTQLPEYVGSQACLGCHSDTFLTWKSTGHANMLVEIKSPADFPLPLSTATEAQKAELLKANYVVAGQRFVARNNETGEMKYLNVVVSNGKYADYKGGASYTANTGCAGCHTTNYDLSSKTFTEAGIGCEDCHGPGRDHVLGKGDVSKITVNTSSDVCGVCHNGGKNADGTSWAVGYRPSMKISDSKYVSKKIDTSNGVPVNNHARQYPFWEQSGHAKAVESLSTSDHASDSCWKCHSDQAFRASLNGETYSHKDAQAAGKVDEITCATCHDPHNSTNPAQLRMEPQALCTTCHTGSINKQTGLKPGATAHHDMKEFFEGYGAIGIAVTPSVHQDKAECVQCHMTEGNHLFQVILPENVAGTTREDSCTACHKDSSEVRGAYLSMWQDTVTKKLTTLSADMATIDAALKANPDALNADLKNGYAIAKTNISMITADGSNGAHNFSYAMKILLDAQTKINAAKAGLPK